MSRVASSPPGPCPKRWTPITVAFLSMTRLKSCSKEIRKKALDARSDPDGAISRVAPRALRRRLSRLTRLLHFLPTVLRALGHCVPHTFGRLFDALPDLAFGDLLRAALDMTCCLLHLRIIGAAGESGGEQKKREHEHGGQQETFHRSPLLTGSGRAKCSLHHVLNLLGLIQVVYWTFASPATA